MKVQKRVNGWCWESREAGPRAQEGSWRAGGEGLEVETSGVQLNQGSWGAGALRETVTGSVILVWSRTTCREPDETSFPVGWKWNFPQKSTAL